MSEEPELSKSQKILLLSPDDEQTRLIGKAIASETAGKILSMMAGREVTAMFLSEEMSVPVSTVMYHLENLVSAGLIEVSRIRYSVKGREMKVYRLVDQVLIVSSGKHDIKTVLTRCATLFSLPLAIASLLAIYGLNRIPKEEISSLYDIDLGGAAKLQADTACYSMERVMEAAPVPEAVSPILSKTTENILQFGDIALGIIIGALLVILAGLIIDYIHKKY